MAAHRFQATWRGTTFNPHYDNSGITDEDSHVNRALIPATGAAASILFLDELDVTSVSSQDYRELRQYLEGAEGNEAYEGVRALVGRGRILAGTPGDLEDAAWSLYEQFSIAACRAAAVSLTPKGVLPFDFRRNLTAGGVRALRAYCRPAIARPIVVGRREEGLARAFLFNLVSFDPFIFDVASANTNLGNLAGGANAVTNPGNIYTYPTIVITFSGAGGAAVTLTNTTTGQSIVLNLTSYLNLQTLTIDTRRSTIIRDNGTNQMLAVTSGFLSNLFLNAGANNITWSAAGGITSVQFQVRGAYA